MEQVKIRTDKDGVTKISTIDGQYTEILVITKGDKPKGLGQIIKEFIARVKLKK